ncbi:MAG: caspase [Microcystis panniformis Mp_MB_F_20051200_S9]|uniref:Caspase n=1 Tax=Microcystis panniformis Mp_MB_F_20051200_S9 TaxID=2486223 RepID=A0A552PYV4_9CHRO|nr:MAG: caspase [Microcystis panniformis Mp_GB_SS_20050300_S99D]TRV49398.1 MAG: caspase [Microcystis panniformis Mp_MB_F_20080800_S26D]TRV52821.1 MAG: caspase [Microcystis panniformis Mp_GB_SS_20050300_S99]TRV57741.1 MAG: caspase [Microcystis panniformis Mp_MB_F_20080800_S26]TRV62157.1 MAG: caspase [Microcystis panniformis Mp_MB_F_20051200_S9]TRV65608.1 MAG: caspase [Microcystis panniformis Mp_MB_F_20051200_S9D]TRV77875.1 MAG: caspase [Microcystis panniformis Mp_MB_F_20051200_S6]TRV80304.1 M
MAKFALLIGVSEYSEGLRPISSAILDVEAMRRVLEHPDMGAFDQVTVLPNPDKGSMETAVEDLFANRQRDDLVLLYFSGHGLKDQNARFFLSTRETGRDQNGDFRRATALAASKLQEYITDSRSQRQIIILDCCFSGALVQGMPIKGEFNIQEELGGKGRAILTSSSPIEYSFESDNNDLSIYTKYLVEGIETGAADKDGDQLISVNELHEYASERVKEAAPAMTPKFHLSLEGDETIYLAKSPLAATNPIFIYREKIREILDEWSKENICQENFNRAERNCLNELRNELDLSLNEADIIEQDNLAPFRKRLQNLTEYKATFRELLADSISITEGNRRRLKELQSRYGLRDEDIQVIEEEVQNAVYPITPTISPSTSPSAKIAQILHSIKTLKPKNFKLNLPVSIGIASIAVVSLIAINRHNIITPLIPSDCPKQTDDFISEGEEILNYSQSFNKKKGAEYFAQCDYQKALSRFKEAWQEDRLDPETLIYLNNALLEANKMPYYTIAVAVSIPKNENSSNDDGDSRAKEMLRGVAQLQTKINLGLLNDNDPFLKYFPDQNFINKKAINGKGLKVVITNDENKELLAKKTASSLSQRPEILGVVGHYTSEMTLATVDIYNQNNLVLISPGSTTSELTNYPRKNFLRTVFSSDQQSPAIAKFLQEKSIKKVVGFYSEGSPFSESFFNSFKTIFTSPPFSGTVVKLDEFDLGNNFDEKEAIQELRRQKEAKITETIGLVLFPKAIGDAQGDAIRLIKLNNSQNWVIGSWGLRSSRTLEQIDNLQPFQKFVIAVPWDSLTSPNKNFLKDAKILWTTTSVNAITALSYDATLALTKALEKENTPTRINILEHLKSPDFLVTKGATGTIQFDENGDRKKIDENGEPQNPSVEFVHIVECRTLSSDFAFVPIKYPTAKDAGLSCLNSPKKPSP